MPAIDFPNSPSVNQVFTSGVQSWIWDGVTWSMIPIVGGGGGGEASIAVGPTAPVGPDDGDLWWDTDEPSLLNALVDPVALVANATFQAELAASAVYNAVLNGRYVAVPTAWVAPTLINSWVNFGGSEQTARYRKIGDMVFMEGLVKLGTGGASIFTLPTGFRPLLNVYFAVGANDLFGMFYVTPAGNVIHRTGSNVWFSLTSSFSTV